MALKKIDPEMAARVWQRVQASLDSPTKNCCPDDRPIPRYRVPPEAWRDQRKPTKAARHVCCQQSAATPLWAWLVLLWLLVS